MEQEVLEVWPSKDREKQDTAHPRKVAETMPAREQASLRPERRPGDNRNRVQLELIWRTPWRKFWTES